jgi:hypothetical protein
MITRTPASVAPVKAKLLVAMVYNREFRSAGEVIEMSAREFKRFYNSGHVDKLPEKSERR